MRYGFMLKGFLMIVGGVTTLLVAVVACLVVFDLKFRHPPAPALPGDIEGSSFFAVPELAGARLERVEHRYVSNRAKDGAQAQLYAVRMAGLSGGQPACPTDRCRPDRINWIRGDSLPPDAAVFVESMDRWSGTGQTGWFPRAAEVKTGAYYVYSRHIHLDDFFPSDVDIVVAHPSDGKVFLFKAQD